MPSHLSGVIDAPLRSCPPGSRAARMSEDELCSPKLDALPRVADPRQAGAEVRRGCFN